MLKARFLVAVGSLLASTAVFAHEMIDPIAGLFDALAGNGGLAWFLLYNNLTFL